MSTVVFVPGSRHPFRLALLLGLSATALGLTACGDPKSSEPVLEGIGIASPALAIVHSDYATSRLSLYRPADGRLVDACTGSTSADPGLVQPLSGDVGLPTQPKPGGELVLIDSGSSVVTFLNPSTCAARGQVSVSTGGFKAYPHDVVTVSEHKAYVTRSALNAKATVDPGDFDDGDDLLIIDPTALTVLGRISMSADAAPGPMGEVTQARPDRAVLVGTTVYVTLNSINADFSATGEGRVAVINTVTDTVTGTIALPAQKNCSGLNYVAATKKLYVSCGGAFSDLDMVGEAALVELDLTTATPVVSKTIAASQLGALPINFAYNAVLADAAFVGTMGTKADPFGTVDAPDRFFRVSLATGEAKLVAEGAAYNLGSAAVDKGTGRVFLPDADAATPRIRVFTAAGEPAVPADFDSNPSAHLPPRGLAWY